MAYYNPTETKDTGNVSEWNEGNFKNLRLHEAQELINSGKIDPLRKENGIFKYRIWIYGIEILYGEGSAKYAKTERVNVEEIKELLIKFLLTYPPYSTTIEEGLGTTSTSYKLNYNNWDNIRRLIEIFENRVKYFNDIHGLSTRNQDYDDEGL